MNRAAILASSLAVGSLTLVPIEVQADSIARGELHDIGIVATREAKSVSPETSGARAFILKGHRIVVPADKNAEALVKILMARYPDLKAETAARR